MPLPLPLVATESVAPSAAGRITRLGARPANRAALSRAALVGTALEAGMLARLSESAFGSSAAAAGALGASTRGTTRDRPRTGRSVGTNGGCSSSSGSGSMPTTLAMARTCPRA
ncbi:conserved hypothetical protein [Catenulispora acidiphila DSM 44928]|uniref:Uncharacterized protein n=1 Tax=Catenulispora acidiphila (strain DSM 44928 / JCM 14897 / NBRC 102108 / NRRL B-24433 / ID139908) TaxID=479433 RepID=C7QF99_CATAD|nr:hypothetical protein [Catenulispora acidiphila]ACU76676.1 conserved hypothetical protein [Catenulispora acidiphila DSM 44928]